MGRDEIIAWATGLLFGLSLTAVGLVSLLENL